MLKAIKLELNEINELVRLTADKMKYNENFNYLEIEITYGDWFAYSQNKFEYKIDKFIKKLNKINLLRRNENEEQIEKRNIQSERYDRQNRKEAYEVWSQNSEDERQSRSSLYH